VQAFDPVTKETFSCKDLGDKEHYPLKKGKKADFIYRLQLLVKDQPSSLNQNFYRIVLFAHDESHGASFFKEPVTACNLYAKQNAAKLDSLKQ